MKIDRTTPDSTIQIHKQAEEASPLNKRNARRLSRKELKKAVRKVGVSK